jgi:mono/diheme cytochrome c family protein
MRPALLLLPALALAQESVFEKDILPIFTANCFTCHGKTAPRNGLDLRTAASALRGSHNGEVISPGSPEKSLLWDKVSKKLMPPAAYNQKLTDEQIAAIRRWIEGGAKSSAMTGGEEHPSLIRYRAEIQPIFEKRCAGCHAGNQPAASLDFSSLKSLLKGSASGPVVVEFASEKSLLVRRLLQGTMPPKGAGEPVPPAEITRLRQWVDAGGFVDPLGKTTDPADRPFTVAEAPPVTAKDREFWSFRKPLQAAVPKPKAGTKVRNPIDAFLLSRLEAAGIGYSPEASKRELLRRVTFDLTGLPPSPEETGTFLADKRADAYERLVDKLLESKHYGERWGRRWLDAAGYSDTAMRDYDIGKIYYYPGMWRYRDYVIRATNEDKPWDSFLTEQIAGDEMVDWRNAKKYTPETVELLAATGYMRNILDRTDEDITNFPTERYEAMFHLIEKMSSGILGLTVGCARCHTHKYDPVPQRDYYRFLALIATSYNPVDWIQARKRWIYHVSKPEQKEIEEHNAEIDRQLKPLRDRAARIRKPYEEKLRSAKLATIPEAVRAETGLAYETEPDKRGEVQKFLFEKFGKQLDVTVAEIDKSLSPADSTAYSDLQRDIKSLEGFKRPLEELNVLWDVGKAPMIRLLQRGSVENPGPKVTPGFLTVVSAPDKTDFIRPVAAQGETSGRRLALAQWLTSREHPLTARVIVNRIWQDHFGVGIVATPDNFGKQGARPSHPELLDWLAVDFMENGWKAKRLHRMIVLSTAYRQTSRRDAQGEKTAKADPENVLLWRMNLRRLQAEELRDSMLEVSGQLDRKMGGPALMLQLESTGLHRITPEYASGANRRSLYILARRNYPYDWLRVFDYPVIDTNCTRRANSATPLQSLTLMNSGFIWDRAEALVDRAWKAAPEQPERIDALYRFVLQREPSVRERDLAATHLARQAELQMRANIAQDAAAKKAFVSLAQALLSSNEFLYVD